MRQRDTRDPDCRRSRIQPTSHRARESHPLELVGAYPHYPVVENAPSSRRTPAQVVFPPAAPSPRSPADQHHGASAGKHRYGAARPTNADHRQAREVGPLDGYTSGVSPPRCGGQQRCLLPRGRGYGPPGDASAVHLDHSILCQRSAQDAVVQFPAAGRDVGLFELAEGQPPVRASAALFSSRSSVGIFMTRLMRHHSSTSHRPEGS